MKKFFVLALVVALAPSAFGGEIYDLDVSAANNNATPPNGFPENMQYSQVNDSARELMAVQARFVQALGGLTTTGGGNAYVLTISQAMSSLDSGMLFIFKADKTNTGASTLRINALTPAALRDNVGDTLAAGDISAGALYLVQYDGSVFRLIGQESVSSISDKGAGSFASLTNPNTFTNIMELSGTAPQIRFTETGTTADNGRWSVVADGERYSLRAYDDSYSGSTEAIRIDRTGTAIDGVQINAATLDVSGALTLGTDLALADGGTGASTASSARTNLGVAIGSDVQAYDADLSAIAALAKTSGNLIIGNGSTWVSEPGPQTKIKAVNTGRGSTTMLSDPHLAGYTLETGAMYTVEGYLEVSNVVSTELDAVWSFSNAPQGSSWAVSGAEDGDIYTSDGDAMNTEITIDMLNNGASMRLHVSGYVQANASTGGTATLQWAPQAAQNITLHKGSWIRFTKVP